MTPQSAFMIVGTVDPSRMDGLKSLLESMTILPGAANPENPIVPFERFKGLHYARLVILDDQTLEDMSHFDVEVPEFPVTLAFLGDCDGPADQFLVELESRAGEGLRTLFSYCKDFEEGTNLLTWMRRHSLPAAANYVNWVGRTVQQVREEAILRETLLQRLRDNPPEGNSLQGIRDELVAHVKASKLVLSKPAATPAHWRNQNLLHLASLPAALLAFVFVLCLAPLLLIPLAVGLLLLLLLLRHYEKTEPEIVIRPPPGHGTMLASLEDHDVSNQFTVIGSVKPSAFRRVTLTVVLWLVDYGARHIYNRGRLGRIQTIHFARWVFLDDKRRVLFASNYDGSLESYMDDFINKVGWGLNLVFSNGVGYPRTDWLVAHGSKDEQKFKYTLRRHQLPTQVWYKAYPGLTAFDLARNTRVRKGIERKSMTDDEVRDWLRDL